MNDAQKLEHYSLDVTL